MALRHRLTCATVIHSMASDFCDASSKQRVANQAPSDSGDDLIGL